MFKHFTYKSFFWINVHKYVDNQFWHFCKLHDIQMISFEELLYYVVCWGSLLSFDKLVTRRNNLLPCLFEQVIVAAAERCLDPISLDQPILDKLIQAKLAKTSEPNPNS